MGRTSAGGNGNDSSESFGIARAVIGAKVMATSHNWGRTRSEHMSSAVHPITDIWQCHLASCKPGWPTETARPIAAALLSITAQVPCDGSPTRRRLGSTISDHGLQNCARMNVASALARLTGRYLAAALSFSPILKIGPIPTPAPPGSTPALEPGIAPLASQPRARALRSCSDTSCHRALLPRHERPAPACSAISRPSAAANCAMVARCASSPRLDLPWATAEKLMRCRLRSRFNGPMSWTIPNLSPHDKPVPLSNVVPLGERMSSCTAAIRTVTTMLRSTPAGFRTT
jgi:hypothetical protein